jgi:hypothetical protein
VGSRVRFHVSAFVLSPVFAFGTFGCSALLSIDDHRYLESADAAFDAGPDVSDDAGTNDAKAMDAASNVEVYAPGPDAGPFWCLGMTPLALNPSVNVSSTLIVDNALDPSTTAGASDGGSDLQLVNYTPIPGVAVQACSILDPFCASPLFPEVTSDDAGIAAFSIPKPVSFFFQASLDGYTPSLFYPGPFAFGEDAGYLSLPMFTPTGVQELAVVVGTTIDLSADSSTTAQATDSLGTGGALNRPAGIHTVTATLVDGNVPLGFASVTVQSGTATFAHIRLYAQN